MTHEEAKKMGASYSIESFGLIDFLKWDGKNWFILTEYKNRESEFVLTHSSILMEFKSTLKPL